MILSERMGCRFCNDRSCATAVLADDDINRLSENFRSVHLKAGKIILSENSLNTQIIYLKKGLVKEYQCTVSSDEYILQIIKPHSYLGLSSHFSDKVNHYSYKALTDIAVCYIDAEIFKEFAKKNGMFGYEILSSVSRESSNNFHRFIAQYKKNINGKLADAILYLSKVIFESDQFVSPLTRNEISYLIGTSRESVCKQMKTFEKEGIIQTKGRLMRILDVSRLEQISRVG